MKNKFTKVTYRSLDTGNEVKRVNKVWIDLKTKEIIKFCVDIKTEERVPDYRVHKYISLSSKLITN